MSKHVVTMLLTSTREVEVVVDTDAMAEACPREWEDVEHDVQRFYDECGLAHSERLEDLPGVVDVLMDSHYADFDVDVDLDSKLVAEVTK